MNPTPLPELLGRNRNAVTVYAALRWLSGEKRQLNTTRKTIAGVCHLSEDTITAAVSALDECGWITLRYGRRGLKSWYRLTFPVACFFPVAGKTTHSATKVSRKNPVQGTRPCGRKNRPQSLKRLGASSDTPSPLTVGAVLSPTVEAIERQRLSEIRAKRLGGDRESETSTAESKA